MNVTGGRCRRQQGMALLLVLWACALLTIVLGSFAILARIEGLQTRHQVAHVQARYAARAGLARAVAALHDRDRQRRWKSDGRPYTFRFQHATVTVRITNEDGKLDINSAKPDILRRLLRLLGVDKDKARSLTAAIADWRDSDDRPRPDGAENQRYREAGRDYGPRNGPFASIAELQMVLGMTPKIYARLAPYVTIWSGHPVPSAAHASAVVVAALPGMDRKSATRYVAARQRTDLRHGAPSLPTGAPVGVHGGGSTRTVVSVASLPDGARAVLRATIRRRGVRANGLPYVILDWHPGARK